jgi:diadenosine tetraphosphatase ApaH/serine/threonine PP2A family protein phosphatase
MILALLSDIHGNREAFDACLSDAATRGAERFAFLGDLVGYGADPSYVIETVSALASKGAIIVKGNHDVAVETGGYDMNGYAIAAIQWTRERLGESAKTFLSDLPMMQSLDDMLFVHAEASVPEGWIYVTSALEAEHSMRATTQRLTFSGHVHRPLLASLPLEDDGSPGLTHVIAPANDLAIELERHRKWHAVLGSVGQPRDQNPKAAYALFDTDKTKLIIHRLAYDIEAAASKIRAAGLPSVLADRLFVGR